MPASPCPPRLLAIVEDDPVQLDHLAGLVQTGPHGASFQIARFSDATSFRDWVGAGADPDVVLMDVSLDTGAPESDESGIQIVADLFGNGSSTQVVYVTGTVGENPRSHTHAYRTSHVSFLIKPVDPAELDEALARALASLDRLRERPLTVRNAGQAVPVWPRAIVYIESDLNRLHIHTRRQCIDTYGSLSHLLDELPATFVQCHKSFAVNMDYVRRLDHGELVVASCTEDREEERIPISQNRRKFTRQTYLAYLADAARLG